MNYDYYVFIKHIEQVKITSLVARCAQKNSTLLKNI